jgi:hypothetical protein
MPPRSRGTFRIQSPDPSCRRKLPCKRVSSATYRGNLEVDAISAIALALLYLFLSCLNAFVFFYFRDSPWWLLESLKVQALSKIDTLQFLLRLYISMLNFVRSFKIVASGPPLDEVLYLQLKKQLSKN